MGWDVALIAAGLLITWRGGLRTRAALRHRMLLGLSRWPRVSHRTGGLAVVQRPPSMKGPAQTWLEDFALAISLAAAGLALVGYAIAKLVG